MRRARKSSGKPAILALAVGLLLAVAMAIQSLSGATFYRAQDSGQARADASSEPQGNEPQKKFPFPRKSIFFNANLAIFLFHRGSTEVEKTFPAYGEEGSVSQRLSLTSPLGLEINAGKYFPVGSLKLKAGVGFNAFSLKTQGSFTLSMPHPYVSASFRRYYFAEEWKNSSLHFYAFCYLVPVETWRLQVALGPIVGYSRGKYPGLEDLEIEDKSPFGWGNLEIKTKTFKNDSFAALSFGAGLNVSLFLVENMAFLFSYKWQSLNPEVDVLKEKVNLSFSRLIFCVEYSF